ncbi:MAG: hypothetical protein NVS3B20_15410 [Polyangiales bacterium]
MSKFGGKQVVGGFENSPIAGGAAPTAGDTMFSIDGYSSELAADGKMVFEQPNDAMIFSALDVEARAYTVDAAAKKVNVVGAPVKFLKLTKPGTAVTLFVDGSRRLWVGTSAIPSGDAGGPASSIFFVLRDKK